jgi:Immunity protein 50
MEAPTYIQNCESVVNFFGCWPSFHDANVLEYEAEADSIRMVPHTWLMTSEVDAKGYFVLRHHALVSLRFGDLCDVRMDAFGAGNILFALRVSPIFTQASIHVELVSVMDLSGTFLARTGEVVSVIPCGPDGNPS